MDQHFEKIFRFIDRTTLLILIYVVLVTFVPIPKENQRFVDIALAFLLGFISSNSQYLTGGTATSKKPDQKVTTEIKDGGTVVTTEPINQQDLKPRNNE